MKEKPISVETRFRFRGYRQKGNIREFSFEDVSPGRAPLHLSLNVDTRMLSRHQVHLQDVPQLCLKIIAHRSVTSTGDEAQPVNMTISETDLSLLTTNEEFKPRTRSKKAL